MVSTHLKNISQNWESSPNRGENKKYLKPPPSLCAFEDQQFIGASHTPQPPTSIVIDIGEVVIRGTDEGATGGRKRSTWRNQTRERDRIQGSKVLKKTKWFWLELPPTQDASHHQDYEPFLVGNPGINLHL